MRQLFVLAFLVIAGGIFGGGAWVLLGTESGRSASADSNVLPTPAPHLLERGHVPPVVLSSSGTARLDDVTFPLGWGCSELDREMVSRFVKDDLRERGVVEVSGPGMVKSCERDGDTWTLRVMAQVGPAQNNTLRAPADCELTADGRPTSSCLPSPEDAAELANSGGRIHIELTVSDAEVRR